ncbi:MAG: helix-turn-helix domain-containing protein, partial [Alphaproteobacteria bacterium]|nr:helix-turn-helix domain-containing protein [Alphaproteobacteria bacterium]
MPEISERTAWAVNPTAVSYARREGAQVDCPAVDGWRASGRICRRTGMPLQTDAYTAPALEKGLDVLELLGRQAGPGTLSGIAEALGLSRNQIFRVVRVLEARGYLLREGDSYALSNRLFLLAARRRPFVTLMDAAAPEMRALAAAIGQSCHLTIPAGTRTVVVARVENPHAISIALPLGHNLPIHETASGRAILAMLPAEECERLIARVEPRAERQLRTRLAQ